MGMGTEPSAKAVGRRRLQIGLAVIGVGLTVAAATVLAISIHPSSGSGGPSMATRSDVVPWVDDRPPTTPAVPVRDCGPRDVGVSTGRHGAWHDMTSQSITVVNSTDTACMLAGDMTVEIITESPRALEVDMTAIKGSAVELAAGQSAELMVGTPASCDKTSTTVAHELSVVALDGDPIRLRDAWLAVGCGDPVAIDLYSEPVEPATQNVLISAEVGSLRSAVAGELPHFTVTLTNQGRTPISWEDCPAYTLGLKEARKVETYLLNCTDVDSIPPGESVKYDMQVDLPAGSEGADWLTWSLNGYRADDGAAMTIG